MANKYSEMSDLELLKRILKYLGFTSVEMKGATEYLQERCIYIADGVYTKIETNDRNFYFGLMIDNKMNLEYRTNEKTWCATCYFDDYCDCRCGFNENPCRAIAECYLLMRDAENG